MESLRSNDTTTLRFLASTEEMELTIPTEEMDEVAKETVKSLATGYLSYTVGMAIQRYYLPCIVIIGIVGNGLSILVMTRKHNRRISCCVYMAFLALSDTCNLIVGTVYWVRTDTPPPLGGPLYRYECKMMSYILHFWQQISLLLVIFMTIDRMLVITVPIKARYLCTPRRAKISAICIFVAAPVFNIPHILLSDVEESRKLCVAFPVKTGFTWVYYWITMCVACFLPFIILITLNSVIIIAMKRHGKGIRRTESDLRTNRKTSSKSKQLTVMLLLVTFMFLLLTLPQYIRYITYLYKSPTASPEEYALYILAAHGSNKLFFTNNAVNFFLYCIGGSKFREDLRAISCCLRIPAPDQRLVRQDTPESRIYTVSGTESQL